MEERNANYPKGIDRGPQKVIRQLKDESVLTAILGNFQGGLRNIPLRKPFKDFDLGSTKPSHKPLTVKSE